jgi:hypothetical protein
MNTASIQGKSPLSLLRASQIRVNESLVRYEVLGKRGGPKKKQLLRLLRRNLDIQLELEGGFLYPAIRSVNQASALRFVSDALRNHEEIKALLKELTDRDVESRSSDLNMEALKRCVLRHFELERFQIASHLRLLSGEMLRTLSAGMGATRDRLRSEQVRLGRLPLYPTLQSETGSPEDDVDTPRSLRAMEEPNEGHRSEFDNWGSE